MQKCLVCGSVTHEIIRSRIREGKHNVLKCSSCGFVFLQEYVGVNYEFSYESFTLNDNWDIDESLNIRSNSQKRVNNIIYDLIIEKLVVNSSLKIAEIGPGIGATINFLKDKIDGIHIDCIEPNRKNANLLKNKFMVDVYDNIDMLNSKYDIVYGNQVFEHISDPCLFLDKIFSSTQDDVVLYLSFPNLDDCYVKTLQDDSRDEYLNFIFHLAHPYYYTMDTFTKIIAKTSWKVKSIKTIQDYSIINYFNWYINGCKNNDIFEATYVPPAIRELNDLFISFSEGKGMGNNISVVLTK